LDFIGLILNRNRMKNWEEEAANLADPGLCKTGNWIAGAKYAAETLYSEEEVLDLLAGFIDSQGKDFVPFKDIQEWFEPFKKQSGDPVSQVRTFLTRLIGKKFRYRGQYGISTWTDTVKEIQIRPGISTNMTEYLRSLKGPQGPVNLEIIGHIYEIFVIPTRGIYPYEFQNCIWVSDLD
jgi:hypothetical protein